MKVKAKNVDKLLTTKKANGGQNNDSQACIYIYMPDASPSGRVFCLKQRKC